MDREGSGLHRIKEEAELSGIKTSLKRNHKIRDIQLWRIMPVEKVPTPGSAHPGT